jgi:hypothetical protein
MCQAGELISISTSRLQELASIDNTTIAKTDFVKELFFIFLLF